MEIIKDNSTKYIGTCKYCDSEIQYNQQDVLYTNIQNGDRAIWSELTCPVCNKDDGIDVNEDFVNALQNKLGYPIYPLKIDYDEICKPEKKFLHWSHFLKNNK